MPSARKVYVEGFRKNVLIPPLSAIWVMSAKLSEAEKIVSQRLQEIKEGLTTTQISELVPGLEKDEQVDLINRLMKTCAEMLKTEGSDVLTLRYRKPMPDGLKQDEQVVSVSIILIGPFNSRYIPWLTILERMGSGSVIFARNQI